MRRLLSALALAFVALSVSPAQAGGLLQDLFAPAPRMAPIVTYYAPVQPQIRFLADPGFRVSRRPPAPRKALAKKQPSKKFAAGRNGGAVAAVAPTKRFSAQQIRHSSRPYPAKSRPKVASVAASPVVFSKPAPSVARIEAPAQIENDPTLRIGDAYMTPEGLRIYRGPQAKTRQSRTFVDFRRSDLGKSVKSQLAALDGATRGSAGRRLAPLALKATAARPDDRKSVDRQGRAIRIVGP